MIALRPYQSEAIAAIYDYFERETGNPLVVLPTGCHAAGTAILMFDGSIKRVEDVEVGDLLMGPDSRPRTVLQLARGREPLYRITPKKGEPFVVNHGHILSCVTTNEGKRFPCKTTGAEIDNVSVDEWLRRSKSWRHLRKLRRAPANFPPRKDPVLDPYVMGALLGDGSLTHGVYLTNPDEEVLDAVWAEMERLGLYFTARHNDRGTCWGVRFSDSEANCSRPNRAMAILRDLGVAGCTAENKFVPNVYRLGSRDVRRQTLAGLIDTDGHLSTNFDFISKSRRLSDDVVFIARSLGLWAKSTACEKWSQLGSGGTYWRVSISGDLDVIPTRVPRKKAPPRRQKKNTLVTGFEVEPVGDDDFFGFRLDGDHLYLTADFVVHHNTGKALCLAAFTARAIGDWPDTRILIVTHVKELIAQNYAEMLRLWPEAPVGIYSAGLNKRDLHAQVLFAGIQSIHKRAYRIQRCDLVLIDEAHLIPRSSNTMYRRFLGDLAVINPTLKIIGFTATPYRLDSGLLHEGKEALFDAIAYDANVADMIARGYLCEVVPKRTETQLDTAGVGSRGGEFIAGQLEAAVDIDSTTRSAVDEILHHGADRRSWLVFCAGVDHAHHVRDAIRERGISCEAILGETASAERDRIIAAYKRGEIRCLTNANVLTTGFNAPAVDLIAMLRPTKSVGLYVQMIGRGTRLANAKENCLVLDFAGNVDRHGPIDRIDGRKRSTDEEGHAPVKTCPDCETILHTAVRVCPQCGHAFPPPEPDLSRSASTSAILSSQIGAEWVTVTDVTYHRHEKPGSPPSLRVEYRCGLAGHREWICFEHSGYARQKAVHWWQKRLPDIPVPRAVDDALRHAGELPAPARIRVRPQGRYTEITAYEFSPCSATSAAEKPAGSAGSTGAGQSGFTASAPAPARTSAIGGSA